MTIVTGSPEETLRLGSALAGELAPGDVVALVGELGAGKTVLAKGIAAGLGAADAREVTSPTFVLMTVHERHGCRARLHHYDAYRLRSAAEFSDLGGADFPDAAAVSVVEWADRVAEAMPERRIDVRIEVEGESLRRFELTCRGGRPEPALQFHGSAGEETAPAESKAAESSLAGKVGDELVGQTVGGCRIVRELGRGAMGSVYLAEQMSLGRLVALKILAPHLSRRPEIVERFCREARAAGTLVHANIVQVYDVGEDRGLRYIRIEYVDGETVQDMLEREGRIPPARAVEIIRQAAMGLLRAEEAGLVHRDVKPENLMVSTRGEVKLADFGLAKRVEGESGITRAGVIVGTPYYMSPEQATGGTVDARSDIYSLGATLYHMVTGEPPFSGATHMEVLQKHVGEPLVPARERFAAVPEAASRLIDRMMAKSPADRFQSARELLVAVAEVKKVLRSGIRPAIRPEKGSAAGERDAANRRRFRRIAADFVAEVSPKKASGELTGKLAARIRDISEGGVFVEADRQYPVGTIIEASFRIHSRARPVRVVGMVRWVKDEAPGAGMGVEFVRMPTASARPIGRLLTEAESAGALSRLTATELHRRLLRHYYDNRGDSATLSELAGRTGASLALVRPVLREFEQHGLITAEGEMVTFVPPEDANLRRALDTWRLQERARE